VKSGLWAFLLILGCPLNVWQRPASGGVSSPPDPNRNWVLTSCETTSRLELELESELDRTWTANLIERAETSIGAAGPQAARQRFRGVAKEEAG